MNIGYTTGVFDLFHVGHLRLIKNAKKLCDKLIVGVSSDSLVYDLKGRRPVIPLSERLEIVKSISYVDSVVVEEKDDKKNAWEEVRFNTIFKGDDWKGSQKWNELQMFFDSVDVRVVFLPYTDTTSSTLIKSICEKVDIC